MIGRIIEEIGPNDKFTAVNRRVLAFLNAGVPEVWTINQDEALLTIYHKGTSFELVELRNNDTEALLPDGCCRIVDLYSPLKPIE